MIARLAGAGLFAKRQSKEQEQEQLLLLLLPSLLLLPLLHKATEFIIMKLKKINMIIASYQSSLPVPACLPANPPACLPDELRLGGIRLQHFEKNNC